MKTKLMFVLMAFSIVVWAGAGLAADRPTASGGAGSGGNYVSPPTLDLELWCQPPDFDGTGTGLAAQEDIVYPFEAWMADDYTAPNDMAIERIVWWGVYFPAELCHPDYFVISFFDPIGDCNPGLNGAGDAPPPPLFERVIDIADVSIFEHGIGVYEYEVLLDGSAANNDPVLQDAGRTYFLSIQAGMIFADCNQWGWWTTVGLQGCTSSQLFPLLQDPIAWNNAQGVDMSFCLYASDQPIAVENQAWGSVKALFK